MRTKHPRLRLLAVVLSLSAMLAATAPVYAADPVYVDIQGCDWVEGGETTVPAGADINVFAGWLTDSYGQQVAWLKSVQTTLEVDGTPITGTDSAWGDPEQFGKHFWGVFWTYPLALSLDAGDSITVYHAWSLRVPVYDGVGHYPTGLIFEATCTITAE